MALIALLVRRLWAYSNGCCQPHTAAVSLTELAWLLPRQSRREQSSARQTGEKRGGRHPLPVPWKAVRLRR